MTWVRCICMLIPTLGVVFGGAWLLSELMPWWHAVITSMTLFFLAGYGLGWSLQHEARIRQEIPQDQQHEINWNTRDIEAVIVTSLIVSILVLTVASMVMTLKSFGLPVWIAIPGGIGFCILLTHVYLKIERRIRENQP